MNYTHSPELRESAEMEEGSNPTTPKEEDS
jgi:hypothetical protein